MNKRIVPSELDKNKPLTEDIPGVAVRVFKLPEYKSKEFLVMSTGVVYVRDLFYVNKPEEKWRYLHDDMSFFRDKEKHYLLHSFRKTCDQIIAEHIKLYSDLFQKAEQNTELIRKAISILVINLSHQFSKVGVRHFIEKQEFEPWI